MWEWRSSITFKKEKTVLIYFTRTDIHLSNTTVKIKKQKVQSVTEVKLLKIVMNNELCYRIYMTLAVIKRLKMTMILKRLQMISSLMARQLFICIVASVVNYTMIVWRHVYNVRAMTAFNKVQKIETQAVTDVFITVFIVIAETETCLKSMQLWQTEKAVTTWIRLWTLLISNSLTKLNTTQTQWFNSLLSKLSIEYSETLCNRMKTIKFYNI